MRVEFLNSPNLPNGSVTAVFASILDKSLELELSKKSIKVVPSLPNQKIDDPVRAHADILLYHLGGNSFIVDSSQQEIIKYLKKLNCDLIIVDGISSPYPNDCLLNAADIGDYIICNKSITHKAILNCGKKIVNVKQGYSKCSACVIGKNRLITDDLSLYNAVIQYSDINALLVQKGSVKIEGYSYGFIGGCSGLIDKNLLFFNGDLSTHSDYLKIKQFLVKSNVEYIDIKNKPLTDIGSILPISESDGVK